MMEIRLEHCREGLRPGLVRTLSQHVGITFHSVQLTYFKNRCVKSISKFPLWTHLEIQFFVVIVGESYKMKQDY